MAGGALGYRILMKKLALVLAFSCLAPGLSFAQPAAVVPHPPVDASLAALGFGRLSDCEAADWRLRVGNGCTASGARSETKRCAEIQVNRDAAGYALAVDGAAAGRLGDDGDLKRLELLIARLAARRGWTKVRPATYSCGLARSGR